MEVYLSARAVVNLNPTDLHESLISIQLIYYNIYITILEKIIFVFMSLFLWNELSFAHSDDCL